MITCMSIAGTDYIYVNYVNSTVTDDGRWTGKAL